MFHRLMDRLAELLSHSRRIEIPGASHIHHEDNPKAYNEEVLSFLTRHPHLVAQPMLVADTVLHR